MQEPEVKKTQNRRRELIIVFLLGVVFGFVISNSDTMKDARMGQCEKLFVSQSYQPNLEG